MNEFEARLSECLEALREGRWGIDECLRRYPEHAAELHPQLVAASKLMAAYRQPTPSEDFARASRERFRVASGQRLQEAFDREPHPSFFVAARVRFLAAAHQMHLARGGSESRIARAFQMHARAMASAAAVLIAMLSFSTYTVASADGSLPGDWQYPVKLQTERIRLALAFGDGAKRDVKLDIAEERAREIEQLTKRGRIIGPGVLDRLVEQTQPLIDEAGPDWNTDDVARLHTLAASRPGGAGCARASARSIETRRRAVRHDPRRAAGCVAAGRHAKRAARRDDELESNGHADHRHT